mmetsp:Transcript_32499/g.71028  ORF Transcript_32499/g.71028 Transcript_32499/m.71028 type:complete len:279 (-) Transcript_32499:261-1097(-)|eukprot:CAMPEP_0118921546 /NCGR_PEP_ID=MMETSP1169-20130426/784_1 /TAXON_ID=36882 /ORGANISM="Pyramimonas obovata, Strain CCMP722" /LENGTH=278 /DNA_ID=CAMNT_0006862285 /DNA_START=85 /DNA_END=921 /DNA_ORIENTATION=+
MMMQALRSQARLSPHESRAGCSLNAKRAQAHKGARCRALTTRLNAQPLVYASAMKDDFLGKLSREINSTAEDRLLVSETLPKVEASNPTTNPAYSTLLDGEWELIYSGGVSPGPVPSPTREIALLMYAGGFTPGMFLMSVASKMPGEVLRLTNVKVTIDSQTSSATALSTATLFGSEYELSLKNTLEAESALRLRETYTQAVVAGNEVALPDALKWERLLFVTYLDETMMVVRDESGAPDVLVRTTAPASSPSVAVEVEVDDDFVKVDGNIKMTEYDA